MLPTTAQTAGELEVYVIGKPEELVAANANDGEPSTLSGTAGKVIDWPDGVGVAVNVGVNVGVSVFVGVNVGVLVGLTFVIV